MYKHVLIAAAMTASAATAFADVPPPPPTEKYTPPAEQVCNPTTVQIYFGTGETVLSKSARRVIEAAASNLDGCAIADVRLTALSSDGRSMPETFDLAENRLATVSSVLSDKGLTADSVSKSIDTDVEEPAVNRPMTRRVEVQLAAYRPDIG